MTASETMFFVLIALILYTYLVYPLILAVACSLVKSDDNRALTIHDSDLPSVTMIISAFNERKIIEKKIENCFSLDYPSKKITFLIGSDGSTDGTSEVLSSLAKNGQIQPVIFQDRKGKSNVVNSLITMSSSDVIVFSDANTLYKPNTIKMLVRHFSDKNVGVVSGRLVFIADGSQSAEQRYWAFESHIRYLEGKLGLPLGVNGAVYAIRRHLFVPFPENKAIADDFILPLKIYGMGYKFVYDRNALAFEQANDIREEFRRRVRIGAQNFSGLREIAVFLSPFAGAISFALWSHKIIRWLSPILLIVVFFLNCYLATLHHIYMYTLLLQTIVYLVAGFAYVYRENSWKYKILWYPTYFVVMNFALLIGFLNFLSGRDRSAWETTR